MRLSAPPPQQDARVDRVSAFTLAEVLITLGIIGVVAALTIPSLIVKHQKRVFATKVKTTYNLVSNALASSIQENGAPNTWDYGASVENNGSNQLNSSDHIAKMANKYFLPYFKSTSSGKTGNNYHIKLANGTTLTFSTDGSTHDGIYTPEQIYIVASFKGKTSELLARNRNYSREDVVMLVSVATTDAARLRFFKWYDGTGTPREKIQNSSRYSCTKTTAPHYRLNCGALIQYDGWEIAPDYPW